MKITKQYLKQVIKEELYKTIQENEDFIPADEKTSQYDKNNPTEGDLAIFEFSGTPEQPKELIVKEINTNKEMKYFIHGQTTILAMYTNDIGKWHFNANANGRKGLYFPQTPENMKNVYKKNDPNYKTQLKRWQDVSVSI